MSEYNAKNYTEQGGEVTHIGGTIIFEDGAVVEGLPGGTEYKLPIASASELGGIKIGDGLTISEDGVLSANEEETYVLPPATKNSLGGVKVGSGLSVNNEGQISVNSSGQSVYVSCIKVSGTSAEGNISINFPGGVARSTMLRPLNSPRASEYYVEYGTERVGCFMVGYSFVDSRAYFHGYSDLGGSSPKEYIIGISFDTDATPSDVVIINDL